MDQKTVDKIMSSMPLEMRLGAPAIIEMFKDMTQEEYDNLGLAEKLVLKSLNDNMKAAQADMIRAKAEKR